MARTVIITDDLTGEAGAKPRRLVVDRTEYEVDLTEASLAELKKALKPFLKNARVTKAGRPAAKASAKAPAKRRGRPAAKKAASPSAAAREWAVANGVAVPKRGRVPASVIAAFKAAQK